MKNKLEPEDMIRLKLVAASSKEGEIRVELEEEMALSGYAGGMAIDFNDHLFLVGTEEGRIHLCSVDYSGDYLKNYEGHFLAVYAVKWNPYHPDVFLSCSADWTIKLWNKNKETPIACFELEAAVTDIQWAPYSSTIFAAVTLNPNLYIYNLAKDKHTYICDQKIYKKPKLTHVSFNPFDPIILIGEDKCGCSVFRLSGGLIPEKSFLEDPKAHAAKEKSAMDDFLANIDKELY